MLVATVLFWSFAIEWLTHRSPAFARYFQPAPLLLIKNGRMLPRNMRTELITKDELMSHLREEGVGATAEVEQACMEPDGMISVIKKRGSSAEAGSAQVKDTAVEELRR